MIIGNQGFVQFARTSTCSQDLDGYLDAPKTEWGASVPCQWAQTRRDLQAAVDASPYIDAHYELYLDAHEGSMYAECERVRLFDRHGHLLKEGGAQEVATLEAVGTIKITM